MRVSLIAAVARNGVIGRDGRLPWHLPADLKRFRRLTTGHHVIMGRRTFESIGKPLAGRTNLVLSRDPALRPFGVEVLRSLEEALQLAKRRGEEEAFVIGGSEVYRRALPLADRIYLTRVGADVEGDVRFPSLDPGEWTEKTDEVHSPDREHAVPFTFARLSKRPESAGGRQG